MPFISQLFSCKSNDNNYIDEEQNNKLSNLESRVRELEKDFLNINRIVDKLEGKIDLLR